MLAAGIHVFGFGWLPSGRLGRRPTVERVAVVLERRRAFAGRHDNVVDADTAALDAAVAHVRDRDLDQAGRHLDRPRLPAVALAADRVPRAGRTAGRAGELVIVRVLGVTFVGGICHVVREERVVEEEERTGPELLARVAVLVGQSRPIVAARAARLDEQEVPAFLGVAVDLEARPSHRRRGT